MIIFISPVERVSALGRDRQVYTYIDEQTKELKTGQPMRKTKAQDAGVTLTFIPDYENLRYITGLWEEIENPYYEDPNVPESISKSKKITKQNLLEIKHNVLLNTYTSQMTGGGIFKASRSKEKVETTFIEKFAVVLYDRPNRFTDETPRGELAITMLKNHPRVAPSKDEVNPSLHWFYISQENEEISEQMKRQDLIDSCTFEKITLFRQSSEMTTYKVGSLCLYSDGIPAVKGNMSFDAVKQQINTYLSAGKSQSHNCNKFLTIMELLKENKDLFEIKYLVQQALNTDVIKIRDGYVFWTSQKDKPNLYKWSSLEKLEGYLTQEMLSQTTEDVQNGYSDLVKELIKKGVRIE